MWKAQKTRFPHFHRTAATAAISLNTTFLLLPRIGTASDHVPWSQQDRCSGEKQRGICRGNAQMRDDVASHGEEMPEERCRASSTEGNGQVTRGTPLPVRELSVRRTRKRGRHEIKVTDYGLSAENKLRSR